MKSFEMLSRNERSFSRYASCAAIIWTGLMCFNNVTIFQKLRLGSYGNATKIENRDENSNENSKDVLSEWSTDYNKYIDDSSFEDLWEGRLSPEIDASIQWEQYLGLREYKVNLVISHCDKPIDWIRDSYIPEDVEINSVHIYSKCGKEVEGAKEGDIIQKLPNHGRCDHSNAYHLAHLNYSHYADDDIIVFFKDNNYRVEYARSWDSMIRMVIFNGFSCLERTEQTMQLGAYSYSYIHQFEAFTNYSKKHYSREKDRDKTHEFKSNFTNMGDFITKLQLNFSQPFISVCYGGLFASTIFRIKEQKYAWPRIEKALQRGDNIEEGHFVERLWAALLSKPLSPHAIQTLKRKTCHSDCTGGEVKDGIIFFLDHCGSLCKLMMPGVLRLVAKTAIAALIMVSVLLLTYSLYRRRRSLSFRNRKKN